MNPSQTQPTDIYEGMYNLSELPSLRKEEQPINYKTYPSRVKNFANLGDIIAVLPACKKFYELTGRKIIFCQQVDVKAQYYPGAVHPTVDASGQNVCVNQPMWEMIKPLIEAQEYIDSFEKYEGQRIDLDFDVIRGKTNVNMPHGPIQGWVPIAFPDLAFDMTKPWVTVPEVEHHPVWEQVEGKIIINFTERYRNQSLDYYYLKEYTPDLVFAGTDKEHWLFCNQWQLNIPRLQINDFLEYAYAIKRCRFIVANQSLGWGLSEAMKTPRMLEMCPYADNCFPHIGEDSYGYFYQVANAYYFRTLYNKTMKNK
jgi:hypothetical protein